MKKLISIKVLGLKNSDVMSLKSLIRVFQMTSKGREYQIVESGKADIQIINYDSHPYEYDKNSKINNMVIATYRNQEPKNAKYAMKMPFIGLKIISLFDKVIEEEMKGSPALMINDSSGYQIQHSRLADSEKNPETSVLKPIAPHRMKALVVDDSQVIRKALTILLKEKNIDVVTAENGVEALNHIESEQVFDLVFLDVVMPGVDGYKVCRKIKQIRKKRGSDVQVVMLTSKSSRFDKVRASLAGCDDYLTKPMSQKEFLNFIDKFRAKNEIKDEVFSPQPRTVFAAS